MHSIREQFTHGASRRVCKTWQYVVHTLMEVEKVKKRKEDENEDGNKETGERESVCKRGRKKRDRDSRALTEWSGVGWYT